jgi:hypothetical protein
MKGRKSILLLSEPTIAPSHHLATPPSRRLAITSAPINSWEPLNSISVYGRNFEIFGKLGGEKGTLQKIAP